jgi:hypothetical protein
MRVSLRGLTADQREARIREVVDQLAVDGRRALLTRLLSGEGIAVAPSGDDKAVAMDVEAFDRWIADLDADREQTLMEIGKWLRETTASHGTGR